MRSGQPSAKLQRAGRHEAQGANVHGCECQGTSRQHHTVHKSSLHALLEQGNTCRLRTSAAWALSCIAQQRSAARCAGARRRFSNRMIKYQTPQRHI